MTPEEIRQTAKSKMHSNDMMNKFRSAGFTEYEAHKLCLIGHCPGVAERMISERSKS